MTSEIFTQANLAEIDWHTDCFKYCKFRSLSIEGEEIDSIFFRCIFEDLDWYWGLFNNCVFVGCTFQSCVFRGCSFPDCKFVECWFTNCQFVKDNLDGDCSFDRAVAYGCTAMDVEGFAPTMSTSGS